MKWLKYLRFHQHWKFWVIVTRSQLKAKMNLFLVNLTKLIGSHKLQFNHQFIPVDGPHKVMVYSVHLFMVAVLKECSWNQQQWHHLALSCEKCKFLDLIPEILNQKLCGWSIFKFENHCSRESQLQTDYFWEQSSVYVCVSMCTHMHKQKQKNYLWAKNAPRYDTVLWYIMETPCRQATKIRMSKF